MLIQERLTTQRRQCGKCGGNLPQDSSSSVFVCPAGHGCHEQRVFVDQYTQRSILYELEWIRTNFNVEGK